MSDTPRTDAAKLPNLPDYVLASDMECLERELAQVRATLQNGLDRDKDDITTPHLATVAINALADARDQLRALEAIEAARNPDTPRTDAEEQRRGSPASYFDFARQLERELAQAKRDGATLARELNESYAAGEALANIIRTMGGTHQTLTKCLQNVNSP